MFVGIRQRIFCVCFFFIESELSFRLAALHIFLFFVFSFIFPIYLNALYFTMHKSALLKLYNKKMPLDVINVRCQIFDLNTLNIHIDSHNFNIFLIAIIIKQKFSVQLLMEKKTMCWLLSQSHHVIIVRQIYTILK